MRTYVVRTLFLAVLTSGIAQAALIGSMHGFVRDERSGHPIAKAHIALRSPSVSQDVYTDARGYFSVVGIPAGPFRLTVESPGYSTQYFLSCVLPNQNLNLSTIALPRGHAEAGNALRLRPAPGTPDFSQTDDQYTIGFC